MGAATRQSGNPADVARDARMIRWQARAGHAMPPADIAGLADEDQGAIVA